MLNGHLTGALIVERAMGGLGRGAAIARSATARTPIVIELLLEVEERPPHERYKYGQKYTFSPNSCNAHSPKPLFQCKCGTNSPLQTARKAITSPLLP